MSRVNQLPVYLTLSEVHRMMSVCEQERDRMLIKLLWVTGCRVSEAINIRAGDLTKNGVRCINLKQGYWRKLTDGIREHVAVPTEKHVFLPPDVLAELRQYASELAPEDTLIGRLVDGKQMTRKTAWLIVKRAAAAAGVLKRRFSTGQLRPAWTHTLRHSAATNLLMQGAPVTLVQSQLGHSSLASTQVYTQLADPHKEALIAGVKF